MNSTKVQFLTKKNDFGFIMKSPNEVEVNDFADDLYSIFGTIEDGETPIINALSSFLSKFDQDQYFMLLYFNIPGYRFKTA